MKKRIFYIAAVAAMLAPSCQREKEMDLSPEGTMIARLADEPGDTRTSYDGDFSIGNFTWDAGDEIAVHLSNNTYDVVKVYPNADATTAKFVCSTKKNVHRDLYAVYPASVVDPASYGQDASHPLKVILPDEYDIIGKLASDFSPVPMVANNDYEETTQLDFYHVGGLLRLTIAGVMDDTKYIKVSLDKDVTGSFAVTNPGSDEPMISSTANTGKNAVYFKVADAETTLGPTDIIVLNVPVPCGKYSSVTVETLTSRTSEPTNSQSRFFEADPLSFVRHHGKKVTFGKLAFTFSIETPVDDIALTGIAVTETHSQKVSISVNKRSGSLVDAAPWTAYFSETEPTVGSTISTDWSPYPMKDSQGNDWLKLSALEGIGNADEVTVSFAVNPWVTLPSREMSTDAAAMQATLSSGTGVSDLDLSKYNFLTGATDEPCETANCYVIQKYGTYLIPCVYGNSFSGNNSNPSSYSTTATSRTIGESHFEVLSTFVNADNAAITSPKIPTDVTHGNLVARVVWQDVSNDYKILEDSDLTYLPDPPSGVAIDCPYILVNFRKESIVPGNIVIALYDEDNHKILWTWHLWVTTQSFQLIDVLQHDGEIVNKFLNVDVGWTPPISYTGGSTLAREQYVVIVCTESGTVMDSFKVSQGVYEEEGIECINYSATYYQWGRKDPFLPSRGVSKNRPMAYPSDFRAGGTSDTGLPTMKNGTDDNSRLQNMILYPYRVFVDYDNYPGYSNLWNSDCNTYEDMPVTKTIYDPTPRGFHMPRRNAFTRFTTTGTNSTDPAEYNIVGSFDKGYTFKTGYEGKTIRFYALGARDYDNSHLYGVDFTGRFYSAGPSYTTPQNAYFLYFTDYSHLYPFNSAPRGYGWSVRPVAN